MKSVCADLHPFARSLRRFRFPFDPAELPPNGIYLLFERGERAHGGERLVRVGTHTGAGQLPSRLAQHFLNENKDRSIFRKNLGRALILGESEARRAQWEFDRTPRAARASLAGKADEAWQASVERKVTKLLRERFSFAVIPVPEKHERLALEAALIAVLASCPSCASSTRWLGRNSPIERIRESGLWQVQGLSGTPLSRRGLERLMRLAGRARRVVSSAPYGHQ